MAGSLNKVMLIGNLGADPEIRRLPSGGSVANMRLATSESWRDKNTGERREKTEWHSIVVFNDNLVRVIEQFVKKGSKLYVEGQLQTRKYQDKAGQDRYSTEVVLQGFSGNLTLLDGRGESPREGGDSRGGASDFGRSSPMDRKPAAGGGRPSDFDDDIPF